MEANSLCCNSICHQNLLWHFFFAGAWNLLKYTFSLLLSHKFSHTQTHRMCLIVCFRARISSPLAVQGCCGISVPEVFVMVVTRAVSVSLIRWDVMPVINHIPRGWTINQTAMTHTLLPSIMSHVERPDPSKLIAWHMVIILSYTRPVVHTALRCEARPEDQENSVDLSAEIMSSLIWLLIELCVVYRLWGKLCWFRLCVAHGNECFLDKGEGDHVVVSGFVSSCLASGPEVIYSKNCQHLLVTD